MKVYNNILNRELEFTVTDKEIIVERKFYFYLEESGYITAEEAVKNIKDMEMPLIIRGRVNRVTIPYVMWANGKNNIKLMI